MEMIQGKPVSNLFLESCQKYKFSNKDLAKEKIELFSIIKSPKTFYDIKGMPDINTYASKNEIKQYFTDLLKFLLTSIMLSFNVKLNDDSYENLINFVGEIVKLYHEDGPYYPILYYYSLALSFESNFCFSFPFDSFDYFFNESLLFLQILFKPENNVQDMNTSLIFFIYKVLISILEKDSKFLDTSFNSESLQTFVDMSLIYLKQHIIGKKTMDESMQILIIFLFQIYYDFCFDSTLENILISDQDNLNSILNYLIKIIFSDPPLTLYEYAITFLDCLIDDAEYESLHKIYFSFIPYSIPYLVMDLTNPNYSLTLSKRDYLYSLFGSLIKNFNLKNKIKSEEIKEIFSFIETILLPSIDSRILYPITTPFIFDCLGEIFQFHMFLESKMKSHIIKMILEQNSTYNYPFNILSSLKYLLYNFFISSSEDVSLEIFQTNMEFIIDLFRTSTTYSSFPKLLSIFINFMKSLSENTPEKIINHLKEFLIEIKEGY